MVFQYLADDAFQLADGVWADTGLLMCGERRARARCDAGVLRLPKSRRYPGHPFGHAWYQMVQRYQSRISGPLMDRIDIHVEVPRIEFEKLTDQRGGRTKRDG